MPLERLSLLPWLAIKNSNDHELGTSCFHFWYEQNISINISTKDNKKERKTKKIFPQRENKAHQRVKKQTQENDGGGEFN
jgi:hypothetical protein